MHSGGVGLRAAASVVTVQDTPFCVFRAVAGPEVLGAAAAVPSACVCDELEPSPPGQAGSLLLHDGNRQA